LITNKNKLYPSCKIRGAYHKENGLEAESVCNAEKEYASQFSLLTRIMRQIAE
jgi:hypothetical protein